MIDRVIGSMFHWYRLIGAASEGASTVERHGALAAVIPAAPERSVMNAVLFRTAEGLEAAYDDLAAAYGEIRAKWTVWVPPGEEGDAAARLLEKRGHVLDAAPMAMGRDLKDVTRPEDGELPEWTREGDVADIGAVNDRAYDFGTDSFSRALTRLPEDVTAYVAHDDGRAIGCMTTADTGGNTEIQLVGVVPEARGRGIAGKLLRHALADAAERGNETATLVATKMGMPVYERAGFAALAPISMWEKRPTASSG